jgi:hypothetical protein
MEEEVETERNKRKKKRKGSTIVTHGDTGKDVKLWMQVV